LEAAADDWPVYRGDNQRTCSTRIDVSKPLASRWTYKPAAACEPTAPVTAGGLVFFGDHGGTVRALDAPTGRLQWEAYTGSAIFFPPAFWNDRLYVGSSDGRVYAFEAVTGRQLWNYRLAPQERWIPVFGRLMSTWPVAGGIVVDQGTVYAAAGIAHFDGTYVIALDAVTGDVKWYNDTSGELSPTVKNGISLQGPLHIRDRELRFLGGNAYEIAEYDLGTGKCLNVPATGIKTNAWNAFYPYCPEYARLAVLRRDLPDGKVLTYNPAYDKGPSEFDVKVWQLSLLAPAKQDTPAWRVLSKRDAVWKKPDWRFRCFAVDGKTLLAVGQPFRPAEGNFGLTALRIEDGMELWQQGIPAAPVRDGLALDSKGRVFVALEDGRILCFTPAGT
jgi:outer membrane protein assembly factor BamB